MSLAAVRTDPRLGPAIACLAFLALAFLMGWHPGGWAIVFCGGFAGHKEAPATFGEGVRTQRGQVPADGSPVGQEAG